MSEKLTIEQMMELRNVGVILTDEWIFKNYLEWSEDQIKEHREMQLRDADQRYNISNVEVNGCQSKERVAYNIDIDNDASSEDIADYVKEKMAYFWNDKTNVTNDIVETPKNDNK